MDQQSNQQNDEELNDVFDDDSDVVYNSYYDARSMYQVARSEVDTL